jgi:DNA-binding LacI/PurR family transcriptional regulator
LGFRSKSKAVGHKSREEPKEEYTYHCKRWHTSRIRDQTHDQMTNRMSSGNPFDFVITNNDEMAFGAIQVMQAGDLDVTDFQDVFGQGLVLF